MAEKVWFITGASRGFGREWTIAALERGDKVAAKLGSYRQKDDGPLRSANRVDWLRKRSRFGLSGVCACKGKKEVASATNKSSHGFVVARPKADGWPQALVRKGFI